MIDRAEVVLHEDYGQREFWKVKKYYLDLNFEIIFILVQV